MKNMKNEKENYSCYYSPWLLHRISNKTKTLGDSLVVQWLGTLCCHCWGRGFNAWSGNLRLHASFVVCQEQNPKASKLMRISKNCRLLAKYYRQEESKVAQLLKSLWLCDPMDCGLPGSSVHGSFQARILEWVAISFSRSSSRPRDWIRVSCIVGRRSTIWATREVQSIKSKY